MLNNKLVMIPNNNDKNIKIMELLNEISPSDEFDDQGLIYENIPEDEKNNLLKKLANLILISESDPKDFEIQYISPVSLDIQDFID